LSKIVHDVLDLPPESGGVIQGEDNVEYKFEGTVDLGELKFSPGLNSMWSGRSSVVDTVVGSGSGVFIEGGAIGAFLIKDLRIAVPTRTAFDIQGVVAFALRNVVVVCNAIGTVRALVGTQMVSASFSGFGVGLLFVGVNGRLTMEDTPLRQATGTGGNKVLDFGTSTFTSIQINNAALAPAVDGIALSGLVDSGNLTDPDGVGSVTHSSLFGPLGVGTSLENITVDDDRWRFIATPPEIDSAIIGSIIQTGSNESTSVDGPTKLNMTTAPITLRRFEDPPAVSNQLKYKLLGDRAVLAVMCFSAVRSSGVEEAHDFGIAVGGSIVARIDDVVLTNKSRLVSCTFELPNVLTFDDIVEIWGDRTGGADTVFITGARLIVMGQ
jgi:hypothetical protein